MSTPISRREFIRTTSTAASLTALASVYAPGAHAAGAEGEIKVGLVGCGGRGTGAASQALTATDTPVKLWAMGDLFPEHLARSYDMLTAGAEPRYDREAFASLAGRMDVPEERRFYGFDAYQSVIDSGVDMVILATPPHFRPLHFEAAVMAGKHVFMEKPVAVDPVGIRRVLASAEEAKKKNLSVVAGTQRRHQDHYVEILRRVQDGAIGEIVAGQCYWNMGSLGAEGARESWEAHRQGQLSDMEYQCRNWYYHVWLSGDHICEQHVHNIDVMHWALGANPVMVTGVGGRQERTQPEFGNIYDHFGVELEFPGGVRVASMCRQWKGSGFNVAERLVGTRGQVYLDQSYGTITGPNAYEYEGPNRNPYVQEHASLINSIRRGEGLNEGVQVAHSTLSAIAGRMAAYTGREMKWEWALRQSALDLTPPEYAFGDLPPAPPAVPGETKLV